MRFLRAHDELVRLGLATLAVIVGVTAGFSIPRDSHWWVAVALVPATLVGVFFVLRLLGIGAESRNTTTAQPDGDFGFFGMIASGRSDISERMSDGLAVFDEGPIQQAASGE